MIRAITQTEPITLLQSITDQALSCPLIHIPVSHNLRLASPKTQVKRPYQITE